MHWMKAAKGVQFAVSTLGRVFEAADVRGAAYFRGAGSECQSASPGAKMCGLWFTANFEWGTSTLAYLYWHQGDPALHQGW